MIMIRTILAPTDFSTHANEAVRYACGLALKLDATLYLLNVLPDIVPAEPDLMLAPSLPPEFYQQSEDQASNQLRGLIDPTWGTPKEVRVDVRWGGAVEGIVDYASDRQIDLIVIASHGRTGLRHALLGSVAERIVREAPCPVLTIRAK